MSKTAPPPPARTDADEAVWRLAAIVESSDDAIVGKTLDGIVTSWNAGAERLFGYTAEEMIGHPISRLLPPERANDFNLILETIRRGARLEHFETERIRKDGRRIFVSLTISPIRDASGRVVGASKIARDVTDRKLQDEERERLLGVAQQAWAQADAANRAKDEFLAMLGHELRNPLSAVRNAIASARLEPAQVERALEIASRQTELLARLVDDLLDVANITQNRVRLNLERVPLRAVIERAMEAARFSAKQRGLALSAELPSEAVFVHGDPARLEQVIANLLANAIKYSEPGGRIELRSEIRSGDAVVRVRDEGIGISPELLPRVFDLFVQEERGLDRSHGGLGIGLTVVRSLVELHGGRVHAHSAGLGRGAEFTVSLPISAERTQAPTWAAVDAQPARSRGARVLIVEDNPDAAEGLMMLVEAMGHEVRVATNGLTGLELAREHVPDLMLVDIGLPGIDGYELARRARASQELRDVPLVALTGYGQSDDRARAHSAGFVEHLVKPVDPDHLRELLRRFTPSLEAGEVSAP